MASNSNPLAGVTEGLTNAFQLANMIHRQRIEDQSIQLQKQREMDVQQEAQSREARQQTQLEMNLHAMGARQATPSDDLEAETGTKVSFGVSKRLQDAGDGLPQTASTLDTLPSFSPSDLKSRFVKAGGQKWVMPSQEEQDARTDRANQKDSDAAVAKVTATETARGQAKIAEDKSRLDTLGVPIDDKHAELIGLPKGTKILAEHADDYMRAVATALSVKEKEKPHVVHSGTMEGTNGIGVYSVMDDGTVKGQILPQFGKKPYAPKETSPNEQRLADKAATDTAVEERASEYAAKYPKFEDADAALKQAAQTDPFVKKQYLRIRKSLPGQAAADKPKTVNNMSPEEAINALGQATGTPAAAGTPAPKKAAPVVAPAPNHRAYNKKTKEWMEYDGKAWVKAKGA